jgi:hypothetical protein
LKMAIKYNMPYDKILYIIACSIKFNATDEHGLRSDRDKLFAKEAEKGIAHILEMVCMLSNEKFPNVHREAEELKIQCI